MTRNYQQDGYTHQANNRMAGPEAEESVQKEEYRNLYDPFNIKWKNVLGHVGAKAAEPVLSNSKGYAVSVRKEPVHSYSYGRRVANSPRPDETNNTGFNSFESQTQSGDDRTNASTRQKASVHFAGKWAPIRSNKSDREGGQSIGNTYGYYTTGYGPRD